MTTATEVREKPILFSAAMVNAILANRKSMTRRIVKLHDLENVPHVEYADDGMPIWCQSAEAAKRLRKADPGYFSEGFKCPYGFPGDRLYVRETWFPATGEPGPLLCHYRADSDPAEFRGLWKPSIHMPRWASRITLELLEVRVERVQDISAKDILAEGVVLRSHNCEAFARIGANPKCPVSAFDNAAYPDLRSLWAAAWEKVNGKGAWGRNDFCWVLGFRRLEAQ